MWKNIILNTIVKIWTIKFLIYIGSVTIYIYHIYFIQYQFSDKPFDIYFKYIYIYQKNKSTMNIFLFSYAMNLFIDENMIKFQEWPTFIIQKYSSNYS